MVSLGGCAGELFFDPVVALAFEFLGQFLVATVDDTAVEHDVDDVGHDVVEQTLVVSDDEEAAIFATHVVNAFGDDAECVDVEARVGLIHHAILRIKHGHLENLAALLFAAGEALIEGAGGELAVDLERVHLGVEVFVVFDRVELFTFGQAGLASRADEIGNGDARYFHRILESEEEASVGDLVGLLAEDAFAVEEDFAALHRVVFVTRHDLGERAFTRAVGAHQCVDFALRNREIKILEDGLAIDGNVEIFDFE